jgi:hypothetical protein
VTNYTRKATWNLIFYRLTLLKTKTLKNDDARREKCEDSEKNAHKSNVGSIKMITEALSELTDLKIQLEAVFMLQEAGKIIVNSIDSTCKTSK